ncbi:hypothetical protein P0G09_18155, partial [Faecalibacterium sp. DFI.5.82]|nr:hypothetical protein [Faecalibacterium sp. DFI.5.82]
MSMAKWDAKEEALPFAELACPAGYQVLAVDLPEHGERRGSSEKLLPWVAVPELEAVYSYAAERWKNVSLRAKEDHAQLERKGFLLVDSGATYLD